MLVGRVLDALDVVVLPHEVPVDLAFRDDCEVGTVGGAGERDDFVEELTKVGLGQPRTQKQERTAPEDLCECPSEVGLAVCHVAVLGVAYDDLLLELRDYVRRNPVSGARRPKKPLDRPQKFAGWKAEFPQKIATVGN